ncbi:hypothetical protein [Amycolatopsis minnesotensis]|uniref:Secreted protein n=1 Tax=Amycolatopsis minnesotensis TaxID=337894 RepID=A0ABP5BNF1_9PSEU
MDWDWVWFGIAVVLLGAYGGYQWRRKRRGRDARSEAAARLGWQYDSSDPALADRYSGEPFDQVANGRAVHHVFRGEHRDREATVFQLDFAAAGTGTGGAAYRVTTVGLPSPKPGVAVSRRGSSRVRGFGLGVREIGDPDFDAAFEVTAEDAAFARDLLMADVRAWLREDPRAGDTPFRIQGTEIITWRHGPVDPGDLHTDVDFLCDLLDRIPREVFA